MRCFIKSTFTLLCKIITNRIEERRRLEVFLHFFTRRMEKNHLFRFVHSIHQRISHRPQQIPILDPVDDILPPILDLSQKELEKNNYVFSEREHFCMAVAMMDGILHGHISKEARQILFEKYLPAVYSRNIAALQVLPRLFLKSPFQYTEGVDVRRTAYMMYDSYIASPFYTFDCVIPFHQLVHQIFLVSYIFFDIYQRFGLKRVEEWCQITTQCMRQVMPIYDEEALFILSKHPTTSFKSLIQELVDTKSDQKTSNLQQLPFDPCDVLPMFATLFVNYYQKNEDVLEKEGKYPKIYEYTKIFHPTEKMEVGLKDIAYYHHVFPLYFHFGEGGGEDAELYYVPFVQIEPIVALRYYLDYQVMTKLPNELVKNHMSEKPEEKAKVLVLDKDKSAGGGALKDFTIQIQ